LHRVALVANEQGMARRIVARDVVAHKHSRESKKTPVEKICVRTSQNGGRGCSSGLESSESVRSDSRKAVARARDRHVEASDSCSRRAGGRPERGMRRGRRRALPDQRARRVRARASSSEGR
jgi:hypothetical protein